MLRDHVHLLVLQLEAFGDLLREAAHRLGRDVHMKPLPIPAGGARVRLEGGVDLGRGSPDPLHEQRIAAFACLGDQPARPTGPLRERAHGPAHVPMPAGGRRRPLSCRGRPLAEPAVDGGRALSPRGPCSDRGRKRLVAHPHQPECLLGRVPVDGRDGRHLLTHVAHQPLLAEQLDRRPDARERPSRVEVDGDHARVRMRRAQDDALELALVAHVGGIHRLAGHLLPRLHAGPARIARVEAPGTGIANGGEDSHVGPAAAQVPGQRLSHILARGLVGAALPAPAVVEGDRLDHEPWCAVAALQRVVCDECPLHRMQIRPEALDGRKRPALQARSPAAGSS